MPGFTVQCKSQVESEWKLEIDIERTCLPPFQARKSSGLIDTINLILSRALFPPYLVGKPNYRGVIRAPSEEVRGTGVLLPLRDKYITPVT